MKAIRYLEGDATAPQAEGPAILVHVCNDVGGWGRGFVNAISKRWKPPEQMFRRWYRGELDFEFHLGAVQLVRVEPTLFVANLVGQRGLRRTANAAPAVRYDAIRAGLAIVRDHAQALGASVHMPRIGCGLAGGRWEEITPLIADELLEHGVDVTVYDLPAR